MKKKFPLSLDEEMYELIKTAAFITNKSKHQYCLDAIKKEAKKDSQKVIIKTRSE